MPKHSRVGRPFAALAAALLLAACQAETAPAPRAERPVQVQSVAFEAEDAARDFVGVVRARYETDLGFRVAGKMIARLVNVGDRVHAGDVVARLDPEDLRLQVESADAELAAATTNLTQISADFERYETLKARGYASIADFDRKTAAKGEAESRLARAKRALDLARNQLEYSELKAGADGVITATLAALASMAVLDFLWLSTVTKLLYRPKLGALLNEQLVWPPAILFYLLYGFGLALFVLRPALGSGASPLTAALYGAAFGLVAYGAYDLTNHATLRGWPRRAGSGSTSATCFLPISSIRPSPKCSR